MPRREVVVTAPTGVPGPQSLPVWGALRVETAVFPPVPSPRHAVRHFAQRPPRLFPPPPRLVALRVGKRPEGCLAAVVVAVVAGAPGAPLVRRREPRPVRRTQPFVVTRPVQRLVGRRVAQLFLQPRLPRLSPRRLVVTAWEPVPGLSAVAVPTGREEEVEEDRIGVRVVAFGRVARVN